MDQSSNSITVVFVNSHETTKKDIVKFNDIKNEIYRDFMNIPKIIVYKCTPCAFVLLDITNPECYMKQYLCSESVRALNLQTRSDKIFSVEWCYIKEYERLGWVQRSSKRFSGFDKIKRKNILFNSIHIFRCAMYSENEECINILHKMYLKAKIQREIVMDLFITRDHSLSSEGILSTHTPSFIQKKK